MNEIQAFYKLLLKFKFIDEVPDTVQEYVSASQKKALVSSLKRLGVSSLLYSFFLQIYFGSRKMGYSISLSMSKVLAWACITTAATSIAGGTAYFVNNLTKEKTMTNKTQMMTDTIRDERLAIPYQKYRLGIGQFMSRNNENQLSEKVTGIIANELIKNLGQEFVLELNKERKGKKVNLILVGAVGKLGREMIISTKIIDVENSQVLFAENIEVHDEADITSKAKYLSHNIAKYLKNRYKD